MQGKIVGSGKKARFYIDGKVVSRAEFDRAFPPRLEDTDGECLVGFKPLHSEALGVHPDQIPEAIEVAKRKGVPTEFDRTGRPIFTSSRHFREYAKKHGFVHRGYA